MFAHTRSATSAGLRVTASQSVWQGHTTTLRRLLAALLIALAPVAAVAWPSAAHATALLPVDLGTLGGGDSFSTAQNELGQVAGASITSTGSQHPFLWSRATGMADLGSLGGPAANSFPDALSNTGQVVGFSFLSPTDLTFIHAFSWTRSGGMVDLGTLGGAVSEAAAINTSGQIAGASSTAAGAFDAFSWTRGAGMTDLGTLGGGESEASAVNSRGQIVGRSNPTGSPTLRHGGNSDAFSWTPHTGMVALGSLGGTHDNAIAITNTGQVAGQSETSVGSTHAVIWLTGP